MKQRLEPTLDDLNALALRYFVLQPVSKAMIIYLAEKVCNLINCGCSSTSAKPHNYPARLVTKLPTGDSDPPIGRTCGSLPSVEEFITELVVASDVQVPTLLSSLVYLTRLKRRLSTSARGLCDTPHCVFLTSLIITAKYVNDCSPKNKHWAVYSTVHHDGADFRLDVSRVNIMERQFLRLLDWDLHINEEDLYAELDVFLDPIRKCIYNDKEIWQAVDEV